MRVIADFYVKSSGSAPHPTVNDARSGPDDYSDKAGIDLGPFKKQLEQRVIIQPTTESRRAAVFQALTADMSIHDMDEFDNTVEHVAADSGDTIASLSVLPGHHVRLRIRNPDFGILISVGHGIITSVMKNVDGVELKRCEVREQRAGKGFLFGSWRGGQSNYLRFLFAERRAGFIVFLFTVGLILEVGLTFVDASLQRASSYGILGTWLQLGLRLGAPMLVSSLVLLLERFAQFKDQEEPTLRWSANPNHGSTVNIDGSVTG